MTSRLKQGILDMGKRAGTKLFETGAALLGGFNPFATTPKKKDPDSDEKEAEDSDLSVPE